MSLNISEGCCINISPYHVERLYTGRFEAQIWFDVLSFKAHNCLILCIYRYAGFSYLPSKQEVITLSFTSMFLFIRASITIGWSSLTSINKQITDFTCSRVCPHPPKKTKQTTQPTFRWQVGEICYTFPTSTIVKRVISRQVLLRKRTRLVHHQEERDRL